MTPSGVTIVKSRSQRTDLGGETRSFGMGGGGLVEEPLQRTRMQRTNWDRCLRRFQRRETNESGSRLCPVVGFDNTGWTLHISEIGNYDNVLYSIRKLVAPTRCVIKLVNWFCV